MTAKGLRFAHLGDIHLGYGFLYLPREKRLARQRELTETFLRVMEHVAGEKVDLVLVAGDLLENNMTDKTLMRVIDDGLAMVRCPVLMVTGNHDPLLPNSPYLTHSWPDHVLLFKGSDWEVTRLEHLNTTVLGLTYHLPEENAPRLSSIPTIKDDTYKIALVHGSFSEFPQFKSPYLPITRHEIEELPVDYLALGHYHNFQCIHDGRGRLRGCYPGSPEPLDFSETGLHGYVIGEITPEGETTVRLVPLARRAYTRVKVDVSGSETMQEIRDRMQAAMGGESPDTLWWLELVGKVRDLDLDHHWLQEELKERAFFIKLSSNLSPAYDLAELKSQPGVVSYFISYMEGLLDKAETEKEKATITKALFIGLDALLKGEVRMR